MFKAHHKTQLPIWITHFDQDQNFNFLNIFFRNLWIAKLKQITQFTKI